MAGFKELEYHPVYLHINPTDGQPRSLQGKLYMFEGTKKLHRTQVTVWLWQQLADWYKDFYETVERVETIRFNHMTTEIENEPMKAALPEKILKPYQPKRFHVGFLFPGWGTGFRRIGPTWVSKAPVANH